MTVATFMRTFMYRSDSRYPLETSSSVHISRGFVPAPHCLLNGIAPDQLAWQQSIYARAYAEASAFCGAKVLVWKQDRLSRS